MKKYSKLFALILSLVIFACSKDDDSSNDNSGNGGGIEAQATYRITFTTNFTATTHPTDYPENASFGKVFLAAHSPGSSIFNIGSSASEGLKSYAETGDLSGLVSEHSGGEDNTLMTIITGDSNVGTNTSVSFTLNVTPTTTRISFLSKITPSPDWFVGVSSFDLANGNDLVASESVKLFPLDAGSDAGTTYDSPDSPEPGGISQIEGLPFSSGSIQSTLLGTLNIERID